jgi:hypothetical protein
MIRNVVINGIVGGLEKELIVDIFSKLEGSFRQRKQCCEFFFEETKIELSLEDLGKLSTQFKVVLSLNELEIML